MFSLGYNSDYSISLLKTLSLLPLLLGEYSNLLISFQRPSWAGPCLPLFACLLRLPYLMWTRQCFLSKLFSESCSLSPLGLDTGCFCLEPSHLFHFQVNSYSKSKSKCHFSRRLPPSPKSTWRSSTYFHSTLYFPKLSHCL